MIGKSRGFMTFLCGVLISMLALQCTTSSDTSAPVDSDELDQKVLLVELEYAKNFSIYKLGEDTIVSVSDGVREWTLPVSMEVSDVALNLPVNKISCLSTSHLYYFSELGCLNQVQGVSFAESLQDPEMKKALETGELKNLSPSGSEYDLEMLVEFSSDLVTTYPFGQDEFDRLADLGIQSLHFTEYLEQHPLGRAEWIKLVGFLLGKSSEAKTYFDQVKESYILTKLKSVSSKRKRPSVVNANGYSNKWSAPSGSSLVASLIEDAGGYYVFSNDTTSGNLTLDFETVLELANTSSFWGSVVFSDSVSITSLTGGDERLAETKVMKEKRVFYCNAQKRDYFGKGILEPHLILEDLHQIFYSEEEEYSPHYFELISK